MIEAGTVMDGRDVLVKPLASGAFGPVWRARDGRLDTQIRLAGGGAGRSSRPILRWFEALAWLIEPATRWDTNRGAVAWR